MPPRRKNLVCVLPGCNRKPLPRLATCSEEHREENRRLRKQAWHERNPKFDYTPKATDEKPVSDGFYCGGCAHLQACAASERGVQCIKGFYRACAPWTGAPLLKVAR